MEKRVCPLFGAKERRWIITDVSITLVIVVANLVSTASRSDWSFWLWVALLMFSIPYYVFYYLRQRSRVLEVSDEGFAITSWPRRFMEFGWVSVTSVELCQGAPSFWNRKRPYLVLEARDDRARLRRIPVYQPMFETIAEVVRQHVPGSRFHSW